MLQVKARRGGTQPYRRLVALIVILQLLNALREAPGTEYHHTGGQRIKGTGMPHLEPLKIELRAGKSAKEIDQVKAGPADRLINGDDHPLAEGVGRCDTPSPPLSTYLIDRSSQSLLSLVHHLHLENGKIHAQAQHRQDDTGDSDPVPAKGGKGVLLHKSDEETDRR